MQIKQIFIKVLHHYNNSINKFKTFSIKLKLISGFLLMVIPIVIVGLFSQSASVNTIKNTTTDSTLSAMIQSTKYLNLSISSAKDISSQILSQINSNDNLRHYINNDVKEMSYLSKVQAKSSIEQLSSNYIDAKNTISKIIILTDENSSSGVGNSGSGTFFVKNLNFSSIKSSNWYKDAIKKDGEIVLIGSHPELDKAFSSSGNNTYSISVVRAIKTPTRGQYSGLLVIDISFQLVKDVFKDINIKNGGEFHLISGDGRSIYSQNKSGTQKVQNEFDLSKLPFISTIKNSEKSHDSAIINYNKTQHLLVFSKIENSGYVLAGLIPISEIFSVTNTIKNVTWGIVFIAIMLAIGFGLFMSMSISGYINRSVKEISGGALQAANGDLTVQLPTVRKDELGVLNQNINIMINDMKILIEKVFSSSKKVTDFSSTLAITSQQVAITSQNIALSIQDITHGASDQAAQAGQCVEKMSDLSTKIKSVYENVRLIEQTSNDTLNLTTDGLSSVRELDKKANETARITESILSGIKLLEENSISIGAIIKVINQISDRTNLLALNASIEAARAGENGRGFAVVASEIRKLAEQSKQSSKEVFEIISKTQIQTQETVKCANSADEIVKSQNETLLNTISIFDKITVFMKQLDVKVNEIKSKVDEMDNNKGIVINAMDAILAVSEEAASSVQEVSASTEEQFASIQELSSFTQELDDVSKELNEAIHKFKI